MQCFVLWQNGAPRKGIIYIFMTTAIASATRMRSIATANVPGIPLATASACAVVISIVVFKLLAVLRVALLFVRVTLLIQLAPLAYPLSTSSSASARNDESNHCAHQQAPLTESAARIVHLRRSQNAI
jgi:predicted DNA repair protein MutK